MSLLSNLRLDIGDDSVTPNPQTSSQIASASGNNLLAHLRIDIFDTLVSVISSTPQFQTAGSGCDLVSDLRVDIYDDNVIAVSTPQIQLAGLSGCKLVRDLRVDVADDVGLPQDVRYVFAPDSATDNSVVRYDGTTGRYIQDSSLIISDNGDVSINGALNITGLVTGIFKILVVTSPGSINVSNSDNIVVINKIIGEPTSVILPASVPVGHIIIVKDGKGDASINNITISSSVGIDGLQNIIMTQNSQSFTFLFDGIKWGII